MKNGTATGSDHINIDTLKAGEDNISKTLAKLHIKCLSERRIPTTWKKVKMVIIYITNYRPICLLSDIYKVLTKVPTKRLQKTLDESKLDSEADTQRQTISMS